MLNNIIFIGIIALSALFFQPSFAKEITDLPDYSFKYSAKTAAPKHVIWEIWSNVENWKEFDERLEYSYLDNGTEFKEGATGYLKGKNAPKTSFKIVNLRQGESFTKILKLPLYQTIELQRYFEETEDGSTVFVHEVNFKGRLRSVMHALLAGPFKKDLVKFVGRIQVLSEEMGGQWSTLPQE